MEIAEKYENSKDLQNERNQVIHVQFSGTIYFILRDYINCTQTDSSVDAGKLV